MPLRNKILWEGGIFASIPKSEYSLSNESVDYGIMIKERKKHVKKRKILLKASIVFAAVFAIVPAANAMTILWKGIFRLNTALLGASSACRF